MHNYPTKKGNIRLSQDDLESLEAIANNPETVDVTLRSGGSGKLHITGNSQMQDYRYESKRPGLQNNTFVPPAPIVETASPNPKNSTFKIFSTKISSLRDSGSKNKSANTRISNSKNSSPKNQSPRDNRVVLSRKNSTSLPHTQPLSEILQDPWIGWSYSDSSEESYERKKVKSYSNNHHVEKVQLEKFMLFSHYAECYSDHHAKQINLPINVAKQAAKEAAKEVMYSFARVIKK